MSISSVSGDFFSIINSRCPEDKEKLISIAKALVKDGRLYIDPDRVVEVLQARFDSFLKPYENAFHGKEGSPSKVQGFLSVGENVDLCLAKMPFASRIVWVDSRECRIPTLAEIEQYSVMKEIPTRETSIKVYEAMGCGHFFFTTWFYEKDADFVLGAPAGNRPRDELHCTLSKGCSLRTSQGWQPLSDPPPSSLPPSPNPNEGKSFWGYAQLGLDAGMPLFFTYKAFKEAKIWYNQEHPKKDASQAPAINRSSRIKAVNLRPKKPKDDGSVRWRALAYSTAAAASLVLTIVNLKGR